MNIGGSYNWKHSPQDQLVYMGKEGAWHQFRKIGDPREVWCEVLDEDLHMIALSNVKLTGRGPKD
jgi:hypothetical protein